MYFNNESNDHFLLAQLQLGKEEAFDYTFRKYYKILTVQAIRFVKDQDSAQSLVQDCFVKLWEKKHELSNIEDVYSYLYFMMRNRCIDHIRNQKRAFQIQTTKLDDFIENEGEAAVDASEMSLQIWQTIAKLPDRCRKAFEYSRIDGFTYTQIANKMGISNKAVEALISRALKILRANLVDLLGILMFIFR